MNFESGDIYCGKKKINEHFSVLDGSMAIYLGKRQKRCLWRKEKMVAI